MGHVQSSEIAISTYGDCDFRDNRYWKHFFHGEADMTS